MLPLLAVLVCIKSFSLVMKYTVTPANDEMIKKATMMMAAIFGVLLLWIEDVEAVDTSEAEDMECTLGVGSFLCPILLIFFGCLFTWRRLTSN